MSWDRKLRVLVITLGGSRQEVLEDMFAQYADEFEPPVFCPGVSSRSLRARKEFFDMMHEVGLIPNDEWEALQEGFQNPSLYEEKSNAPNQFFDCLRHVPIMTKLSINDDDGEKQFMTRRGSSSDLELHYSVELWRKCKGLNRGRNVLACLLAHMRAMKLLIDQDFDLIVEDNVRLCKDSAKRIWEAKQCSENSSETCHLRYYGWLGSLTNLNWIFNVHSKRSGVSGVSDNLFHFPIPEDLHQSQQNEPLESLHMTSLSSGIATTATPGGTPIWGAYGYWISPSGYEAVRNRLRSDVGAIVWKSKRMRAYKVKPIDKIIPRQVISTLGQNSVHVSRQPSLFRAPMLPSKIHPQWDPLFCESTNYQLSQSYLTWNDLWLTEVERHIVDHYEQSGRWLTVSDINELNSKTV